MSAQTIMAVSAAIGAAGTILGGIGAQQESRLRQFNIGTERVMNDELALQLSRARREEYDSATASNIASFSAMNKEGASVRAFFEKQKEVLTEDVAAIAKNNYRQNLKLKQEALAARRRGRNALLASLFQAGGQVGEDYYRIKSVRTQ